MRAEYEKARRHAENKLAEVNRHLDNAKITSPRDHHMLMDMMEKATRTLENLDRMENARPYSDTHTGYRTDARRRRYEGATDDVNDLVQAAMDAVDRIVPHLDDRYDRMDDDIDDRRGVPGTGPYANPRLRRRGGRYGVGRRRRSEMDNTRYDADDRYDYQDDDDEWDDIDNARRGRRMPHRGRSGRFIRGDDERRTDDRTDDRHMRTDRTTDEADDRTDDRRAVGPRG